MLHTAKKDKLLIIDGMALIYRSHYALIKNPLITKDGEHTSAIYGFFNTLYKIIREKSPTHLVIAMDSKKPTFRHELYSDYKATRQKMPEELVSQIPYITQILSYSNIPTYKVPGYEADDIIGTMCNKLSNDNIEVYIVSGDKDLMQLVNEQVFLLTLGNSFKPETIYDQDKVFEKWSVQPEQIIDFLTLVGDTSDNIPGVPGIGPKTASKLIQDFDNIDSILNNIEDVQNNRIQEKIKNNIDNIKLSKELVTIEKNIDIEIKADSLLRKEMDIDKVKNTFRDLQLHTLIDRLKDPKITLSDSKAFLEEIEKEKNKKYFSILSIIELEKLVKELELASVISIDLETDSINPVLANIVGMSFSIKEDTGYYIPIQCSSLKNNKMSIELVIDKMGSIFETGKYKFCGHNIKYDVLVLSKYNINLKEVYFDSMIAESLINPEKNNYSLDNLAIDYFNYKKIPFSSLFDENDKQRNMCDVPLEKISFYASEDADIALKLYKKQKKILEELDLENIFNNVEMPLINVLKSIEENGIYIDVNQLEKLSNVVGGKIIEVSNNIYDMSGLEFNINSPKQLSAVLFDHLNLKEIKKRSTSHEVLEVLKDHHPIAEFLLEYRHFNKLKNTYIDVLPDFVNKDTSRIHTSFNQAVTSTGRLSSTKPNFQNIPIRTPVGKEIRKVFIPQNSNFKIFSADYSQVELRIMAHFSKEERLIESFNNDEDIHAQTASLIFNVKENSVTDEQRRISKIVNFSIMYGAGPFRLSNEIGISMKEAKELIEHYFTTYPGIKNYIDYTLSFGRKNGFVKTLLNRKRKTFNLKNSNKNIVKAEERAAINMPIQGTAAELIKIAMININQQINKNNLKSKMILQIHDELLFEVHNDELKQLEDLVKYYMENAGQLLVPLKVNCNIGSNWYEAH